MKRVYTLLFILIFSTSLLASGFQINEHGARGMAMGGAYVGLANDASAAYMNPAAVAFLNGTKLSLGATYIAPMSTFTGDNDHFTKSWDLKKRFFTPINVYFTHKLNDKVGIGFAVNNPFGLGTEWPGNWDGRYSTVETEIRTFNFTPTVSYKFSEKFSASVGFSVSYADVLINRKIQVAHPQLGYLGDADTKMEGDTWSYGFIAAVMYKPSESLSLGAVFKSQINYEFEGDATTELPQNVPSAMSALFPKGSIDAPLNAPAVLTAGLAYKANEKFTVTADFQYNMWSSYDKLQVNFKEWVNPSDGTNKLISHRDYEDSYIARVGAEYRTSERLALRAGFYYDKNPVKDERLDPTLPDADRIGFNAGFGVKLSDNLSMDVAYLYLHFIDRTIDNSQEFLPIAPTPVSLNGKYESNAHLFALNFNYNF
ncbi:MAG: OmpP1/FadL family transporter [Rhodothermaceae bacterium]